jgi:hypothetical protein
MQTRKGKPQHPSCTSPLAITMLMHFYAVCTPFIDRPVADWPNAQRGVVETLLARGIITTCDYGYMTTEKGDRLVRKTQLQFQLLMMDV